MTYHVKQDQFHVFIMDSRGAPVADMMCWNQRRQVRLANRIVELLNEAAEKRRPRWPGKKQPK